MKVKEITVHKEMKKGMENYSNVTVSAFMTFEIGDDQEIEWDKAWDLIDRELSEQLKANHIPSHLINGSRNSMKGMWNKQNG